MQLINADPDGRTIAYEEVSDLTNLETEYLWMIYVVRDEGTYVVGLTKEGFLTECSPMAPVPKRDMYLAEFIDHAITQSVFNDDAVPLVRDVVLWTIGGNELRDAVRIASRKRAEQYGEITPHFKEISAAMEKAGYGPYDPIRIEESE